MKEAILFGINLNLRVSPASNLSKKATSPRDETKKSWSLLKSI